MAEKPIIFSGPMVRAILEGRKTQTRRVVKGTPLDWLNSGFDSEFVSEPENHLAPYSVGDLLWIREAFAKVFTPAGEFSHYAYRSDNDPLHSNLKWKPSIHIPREASRITLEVTAVRCERLNEISWQDIQAEGLTTELSGIDGIQDLEAKFRTLWESIHGPDSFDGKWVWLYTFRRVKP